MWAWHRRSGRRSIHRVRSIAVAISSHTADEALNVFHLLLNYFVSSLCVYTCYRFLLLILIWIGCCKIFSVSENKEKHSVVNMFYFEQISQIIYFFRYNSFGMREKNELLWMTIYSFWMKWLTNLTYFRWMHEICSMAAALRENFVSGLTW